MRASSFDHRVGLEAAEAPAILKPIWQRLLDRAIDLSLVVWLFFATNAVIPLLVHLTTGEESATPLITDAPVLLIGPLLIVSRAKAVTALLLRNPMLPLLLLWVWCSALWSVAPEISMRRALILTVYTVLGCYLVARYDLDWILNRLAWLCLALLVVAVIFLLFLPSLSDQPLGRGQRIIFTHKNGMGYFLVVVMILLPSAITKGLVHPVLGSAGLLIALVLLVPVESATAIAVSFFVLATHAATAVWRLPARLAATVTAFGVAIACLLVVPFVVNPDLIFELLNRDATWTGRFEIWQVTWQFIQQRPLVGYGYNASLELDEFAYYVAAIFPYEPSHPHNGYLELLLGIGVVGLTLFMLFIGSGLVRIIIASNRLDPNLIAVLLPLLVGYTLRAVSESSLLSRSSIDWVLIVIFTVSTTPNLASIRRR